MTPAVAAAYERRKAAADVRAGKTEWFINDVVGDANLTMQQRVMIATEYLKTRIVKNISKPVGRIGKRVVERSKPGEFPRAETTQLIKTTFTDYAFDDNEGRYEGYVGTPLNYGLILETRMDRSFLVRTFNEELLVVKKVLETGKLN